MTPEESVLLCRVRSAKERNAAADLAEAVATINNARAAAAAARDAVRQHDQHLSATIAAFHERTAKAPITPGALTDTRAFHADLVSRRFDMIAAIEKADELIRIAEAAAEPLRRDWHRARAALDRAEETRDRLRRAAERELARREESEIEEITLARRMRLERMEP